MILTAPLMLLGLLAMPLLAAIYWFRSRSRRVVVSSLMLWSDQRKPRQGGRFLHRMQAPLCFFLELLAVALLAVAAAGPAMVKRDLARPLLVVLDDSYSMLAQAAGRPSPRLQAEAALVEELRRDNYLVRFVLAGVEPRLVGQPLSVGPSQQALSAWTCQSAWADLQRAIAVAGEVGGSTARILVLGDHGPPMKLDAGQVRWWAFGSPWPNMALTAAVRTASGENERALLEVTNLSDAPGRATLSLDGGNPASSRKIPVELAAGAARQFFFDLPAGSPLLRATLDEDALETDNKAVLLPEPVRPLRVGVEVADEGLRRAVVRAMEATGAALQVAERPDLVICDHSVLPSDAWRLEIVGGKDAVAYTGPFVVDRTHPLARGLSLEGAIWSASSERQLGGPAVVTAGNVTLLSDREDLAGRHSLQMSFAPDLSNLQEMPDWPILFANLLDWRRGALVGVQSPNVRLGQTVTVRLAEDVHRVELLAPSAPTSRLKVYNRRVEVPADRIGIYAIRAPGASGQAGSLPYEFACNALSRDESDLSSSRTGRWGDWTGSPVHMDRQISLRWVFLFLAMACLAAHLVLIGVQGSGFGVGKSDRSDRSVRSPPRTPNPEP